MAVCAGCRSADVTGRAGTMAFALVFALCLVSKAADRIEVAPLSAAEWEETKAASLPRAAAAVLDAPPEVDGSLDDAAWGKAEALEAFSELVGVPAEAAEWVRARLAATDHALYLGAELARPGPTLRAAVTDNYGRVWLDDALEVFLYDREKRVRYQVDLNANGAYWAGADQPTLNWRPTLRCAARKTADGWSVEAEIPWSQLGVEKPRSASLGLQLRYLVNDQSGWAAWVPGNAPSEYGGLVIGGQGADKVLLRRLLFPRLLPPGRHGQALGVEVENTADDARKVCLRLCEHNKRTGQTTGSQTEYANIPARTTRRVFMPVVIPEKPDPDCGWMLLFWGDSRLRGGPESPRFTEFRHIETMPPLRLEMFRERLWAGEQVAQGLVDVGLDDAARAAGDLRVELWGVKAMVAEKRVSPIPSTRCALNLDLRGLTPGAYRLVAHVEGGGAVRETVSDLAIQQAAALPDRRRVAVRVNWPDGYSHAEPAPLYVGVSFPGGMLLDPAHVRVVDGRGRETPCQAEPLARWGPEGSIRWMGIYFSGAPGNDYYIEFGADVRRAEAGGIRVADDAAMLTVDTGAARFELPKQGPLFGRAWVGDRQALQSGPACLVLTDQHSRAADETRGPADEAPVVELAGPQRTIVRREGLYRAADGRRLGKYLVRLAFAVGSSAVAIQHSLILTEDTNQVWFSDVVLRVKPAFGGPWSVRLDSSPAYDAKAFEATLDPARGDAAYLLQAVHRHHFQPETSRVIGVRHGGAPWKTEAAPEAAGQWACVWGGGVGAALTIRNLARTFPKEIEIGPDGLTARLWSGRGGRHLDFRASTLVDFWGADWFKSYTGGVEAARAITSNAAGTARTHDLCLHLLAGDRAPVETVAAVAHLADQPALAVQDPAWLGETQAMGPVHPHDPARFNEIERFQEQYFRRMLTDAADEVGDYGYLDYGSGPHTYPNTLPGKGRPRFYRYNTVDYMGRTAFWLAFARSGDRMYHDYASAFSRHISDYRFSYWDVRGRPRGASLGGGVSEDTPFYWTGMPTFFGVQGNEFRHFLYQRYLTGDRWATEAVRPWAAWMARSFHPVEGKRLAGSMHVAYWMLAQCYEATWDEEIGRLLRRTRDEYLDLRTTTGLFDIDYYGATYKYEVEVFGALSDWLATGAAAPREAFLKSARWMLHAPVDYGPGYQDHSGLYMNHAWRLTGDARYASRIAERLGRMAFRYLDSEGNLRPGAGYAAAYTGPWNTNVFETIACGLDAVARAEKDIRPWPDSETGDVFCILKQPHEPVVLDLAFGPGMDLRLDALLNRQDAIRRDYFVGPVQTDFRRDYFTRAAAGLGGGHGRLTLPVEGLAGEYVLKDSAILWTDAHKLVSLVPHGVVLKAVSARPRQWFFQAPKGKTGAICANRPITLRWGDRSREVAAGEWAEVRGGDADVLYAIHAKGATYVRFAGDVPPVLAENHPDRFFMPANAPSAVGPGTTEDPKALYVPGVTPAEADRGLLLTGARQLVLPTGRQVEEGVCEHFDNRRGTLEFWIKPQWTSRLTTRDRKWDLVAPSAWQLWYGFFLEEGPGLHERSGFQFLMGPRQGTGLNAHRGFHPAPLDQGVWHHVAVCWDTPPERGWVSLIYANGKAGEPSQPGGFRLARFAEMEEKEPPKWRPLNVTPQNPLRLTGAFDAVFDEIRVSDVVRYPTDFQPVKAPLAADDHTLLLLRLDGDASGIGRGGVAVNAAFRE